MQKQKQYVLGRKANRSYTSKVEKSKVVSFRECTSSTADMATQVMGTSFLTVRPNLFRF